VRKKWWQERAEKDKEKEKEKERKKRRKEGKQLICIFYFYKLLI